MESLESLQSSVTNPLIPAPGQELLSNTDPTNSLLFLSTGSTQSLGLSDPIVEPGLLPVELTATNFNFMDSLTAQELQSSSSLIDPLLGSSLGVNVNSAFDTGFFTVGATGEVSFDFLLDGGVYQGELAIFSLEGMDALELGSEAFIQEASRRALSDSDLGHVVISDLTEGARFHGLLGEGDYNSGIYQGVKAFSMQAGDQFGLMIVPDGTVQQVFNSPSVDGAMRPLFSLSTANPNDAFQLGQIADVTGDGSTFVMEDLRTDSWSDRDYNDFIFQVRGATGTAAHLDNVIDPSKDWRGTDLGQALIEYAKPYVTPDNPSVGELVSDDLINSVFGTDDNSAIEGNDASVIAPSTPEQLQSTNTPVTDNLPEAITEPSVAGAITTPQPLVDEWLEQSNQQVAELNSTGNQELQSLQNELSDAANFLDNQVYDLWNNLSSNANYMNAWVDYLGNQLSSSGDYLNAWVNYLQSELSAIGNSTYNQSWDIWQNLSSNTDFMNAWDDYLSNQLTGVGDYLYDWADYTANENNRVSDWMYEWTDYNWNEIVRIENWMIDRTNYVVDEFNNSGVGDQAWNQYYALRNYRNSIVDNAVSDYYDLADYRNETLNSASNSFRYWDDYRIEVMDDAWSEYNSFDSYTDTVINDVWNNYRNLDNYRVGVMNDAWSQYNSINDYQAGVMNDAWSQYYALDNYSDTVMADAWSQYQALDSTRHQIVGDAWNQYDAIANSWNDSVDDTQAQIDVWAKIATFEGRWYDEQNDTKSGLPLIGIIDTGFSANNPDIDYSRITLGKDLVGGDDNPLLEPGEWWRDDHGTKMLEIIAATRDNDLGIDGINDKSPLWLGSAVGSNDWAQSLIEFVDATKESGQPNAIVNLSFDLTQTNPDGSITTRYELTALERAALTYAQQNNVLVVAATGNQNALMSALGQATEEFDNVLVVGAAEEWQRADYSSYGEIDYANYGKGVDLLAQGTASNGAVGSSVAAAKVTGAASLVWAANPNLNYTQVMDILRRTATDLNTAGWDTETGLGLLNIAAAVHLAKATEPEAYRPANFELVQDTLRTYGIPEDYWQDFYNLYYYYDLEAKLTGATWSSAGSSTATERAAWNWEGAVVGGIVGSVVGLPVEGALIGGLIDGNSGGSSGGGSSQWVRNLVNSTTQSLDSALTVLDEVVQETSQALQNGAGYLQRLNSEFASEMVNAAGYVREQFNGGWNAVESAANSANSAVNNGWNSFVNAADYANDRLNAGWNAVTDTANSVQNWVSDAWSEASNAANSVADSVNNGWNAIGQVADEVGDRVTESFDDLEQLGGDFKDFINENNPVKKLADDLGAKLQSTLDGVDVGAVLDVLKRIPVVGTAVSGLEGLYYLAQGDWIEVLKAAINGALGFYGASNVVTPRMVSLFVDVAWELKDQDYKGAISAALSNFNVERQLADTFVNVAWAMKDGQWEDVLSAGLSSAGFNNANEFVDIAWDIIDGDYQDALTTGLQVAGLDKLGIDESEAGAFVNSAVALRNGHTDEVAEQLLSVAGDNAQQLANSSWVQALRDTNPNNDRTALSQGLSAVGFQNIEQWVDMAWDIKEEQYLDALATGFSLGGFTEGKDWVDMAQDLQQENYLDALSTGFKVAGFEEGEHLAKAAMALREGNPLNAFYEGLSLVDGVGELVDAFKYLKDGNAKQAVPLMIQAAPQLAILIGT
jgi:hypothetical protein